MNFHKQMLLSSKYNSLSLLCCCMLQQIPSWYNCYITAKLPDNDAKYCYILACKISYFGELPVLDSGTGSGYHMLTE